MATPDLPSPPHICSIETQFFSLAAGGMKVLHYNPPSDGRSSRHHMQTEISDGWLERGLSRQFGWERMWRWHGGGGGWLWWWIIAWVFSPVFAAAPALDSPANIFGSSSSSRAQPARASGKNFLISSFVIAREYTAHVRVKGNGTSLLLCRVDACDLWTVHKLFKLNFSVACLFFFHLHAKS